MKRLPALLITLALLIPTAHAENGAVGNVFDELLEGLCAAEGSIEIPGLPIPLPGASSFGLDLRPMCQYADIVNKGTRALQDLRDGTLRTTEDLISRTLEHFAGSLGSQLGTEEANQAIQDLDEQLQAALGSGDNFLSAYREVVGEAFAAANEDAKEAAQSAHEAARDEVQAAEDPSRLSPRVRIEANPVHHELQQDLIDGRSDNAAARVEVEGLTAASEQILGQQAENNAYQQTIADTIQVENAALGTQAGIAQQLEQDAQRATSVRQGLNVLTEAIAHQLRNDAILSGAVIENLQASARQQAITNHQLQVLANSVISEEERRIAQEEVEINNALRDAHSSIEDSVTQFKNTLRDAASVTSTEPMKQLDFTTCGMFPSSCR